MKTSRAAEYFKAYIALQAEWDKLFAAASSAGVALPPLAMPAASAKMVRIAPKPRARQTARPKSEKNGSVQLDLIQTPEGKFEIPIRSLSRPQLCLAILRLTGRAMTSQEVVDKVVELGEDWSAVPGGSVNAVHGALWRERQHKNVAKDPKGGWRLLNRDVAPTLDLSRGVALYSENGLPARVGAASRREAMLKIFGTSAWRPYLLHKEMTKIPGLERMPRHQIREDLGALIAEGLIRRVGAGLYQKEVR